MQISNHYVVCLELTMLKVNDASIYKKEKTVTYLKKKRAKRPAVGSLPPGPCTRLRLTQPREGRLSPREPKRLPHSGQRNQTAHGSRAACFFGSTTRSPPTGAQTPLPSCHLLLEKVFWAGQPAPPSPAGSAVSQLLLEPHLPQSQVHEDRAGGSGPAGKARGPARNALWAPPGAGGW